MRRVVWQAASVCLAYPDDEVLSLAELIMRALREKSSSAVPHFAPLLDFWSATSLAEIQHHYVDIFDLSRKHALYLSYWTDGDTRRRGETLTQIKQRYRRSGYLVDTHGELPDFLPLVLEYAARVDPADGAELLQEYRAGLELLRLALIECRTPYASVITAVCDTLPGASPADRRAVMAMAAAGPPTEQVGLEPYDPRLLPLGGRA
jgi:nitrate reductase molybdenum cofactor assembly chaperone NarJ/NarW